MEVKMEETHQLLMMEVKMEETHQLLMILIKMEESHQLMVMEVKLEMIFRIKHKYSVGAGSDYELLPTAPSGVSKTANLKTVDEVVAAEASPSADPANAPPAASANSQATDSVNAPPAA